MKPAQDATLVAEYLNTGDERALEALVKRHMSSVYVFVRRYTGDADVAADITQEAFVKAWKHLKRFDLNQSFRNWILTIAKRVAIDHLKKQHALPFSVVAGQGDSDDFASAIVDTAPSLFSRLVGRDTSRELAGALGTLPSTYATIIGLHVDEGLNFREIAERFNKPLNTIKSQYRRGLALLKKVVDPDMHQNS